MDQNTVNKYLDSLRVSGLTNMFGAVPYIQDHFGISRREASDHLQVWMNTFEERQNEQEHG